VRTLKYWDVLGLFEGEHPQTRTKEEQKMSKDEPCKTCTRCAGSFPMSSFAKNATRPDGHQSWCRPCLKGWRVARIAAQEANQPPKADAPWSDWVKWANSDLKKASAARKAAQAV